MAERPAARVADVHGPDRETRRGTGIAYREAAGWHDRHRRLSFVDRITVIPAHEERRPAFPLIIGSGDHMKEARHVIAEALRGTEGGLADPARRRDALDHALSNAKHALTDAGIDLPDPATQVLPHDQIGVTDGDRTRQRADWPAGKTPPRTRWQVLPEDRDASETQNFEGKDEQE